MGLTSVGLGSGLDINGIVSALVNSEQAPKVAQFDAKEGTINSEISALGFLKSALSEFQDSLSFLSKTDSFDSQVVKLSKSTYLSSTVTNDAVSGSYSIAVEKLAQSQKVGSLAVSDVKAPLAEGSLNFAVDGDSFDIAVSDEDTLQTLVTKINAAKDNVGVTATIVNSDDGAKLVLTSNKTGTANNITVSATDAGAGTVLADTFAMTELQPAKDSIIYVDGLKLTSSSNTIEGAIDGVTLNLKEADIDKLTTLTVSKNTSSIKTGIQAFVDAFNSMSETIASLTSYNPDTKEAGALQGDSLPRSIQSQLRNVISSSFSTSNGNLSLASIGITTTRSGTLEIDDDILSAALESNVSGIKEMFTTEGTGAATKLDGYLDAYVATGSIIDSRDTSLDSSLVRLTEQREAFASKMAAFQARLYTQYNYMDLIVGQLSTQSSDLQSRLDSLPGLVSKKN
ncbi:flagellar filament capping protein FliD [Shewanella frigidimarina]|uniref:Flagellar hook-associated protein 2 n=1 Tax=Shewanella frigidimarina TaxID=56812 RepID=A0A106BWJ8_SHEFR|nr:flagellar filament capping protein FliD [Shewanella frigidimarina]KVW99953.1 flagellar hook protein FliD [Shewanella frigidimarina]